MVFDWSLYFIQNLVYSAILRASILPCSICFFIQPTHPQLNNIYNIHPQHRPLHGWWERFLRMQTSRLRWFAEKTSLPVEVADRVKTRLLFSRSSTNERTNEQTNEQTNEGTKELLESPPGLVDSHVRCLFHSFIYPQRQLKLWEQQTQNTNNAQHTHTHTVLPQIATEGKGRGRGSFRRDLRSGKPRTQSC